MCNSRFNDNCEENEMWRRHYITKKSDQIKFFLESKAAFQQMQRKKLKFKLATKEEFIWKRIWGEEKSRKTEEGNKKMKGRTNERKEKCCMEKKGKEKENG